MYKFRKLNQVICIFLGNGVFSLPRSTLSPFLIGCKGVRDTLTKTILCTLAMLLGHIIWLGASNQFPLSTLCCTYVDYDVTGDARTHLLSSSSNSCLNRNMPRVSKKLNHALMFSYLVSITN